MSRFVLVGLLITACNSSAPTPTKTEPAPQPSLQSDGPKAESNARHFGATFSLAASEPLAQAVARAGKPEAKAAFIAGKAGDKGDAHTCGGDKPVEGCAGAVADESGQKVRVKGTVTSVCQKAGCWMVLEDGTSQARIFTREHKFFLPKDVVGKTAEVEGTLRAKTVSPSFAKHLAEDSGKDPSKVGDAPQREFMMTATGVTISG